MPVKSKPIKPDLSEQITIRFSKAVKERIREVCINESMNEADAVRYVFECGLQIAEKEGIESVLANRRDLLKKLGVIPSKKKA